MLINPKEHLAKDSIGMNNGEILAFVTSVYFEVGYF